MQIATITAWARLARLQWNRNARPPESEARSLFRVCSTGLRAAADYRRLEAMTEDQLAGRGLTRADLPRVLFERHFNG